MSTTQTELFDRTTAFLNISDQRVALMTKKQGELREQIVSGMTDMVLEALRSRGSKGLSLPNGRWFNPEDDYGEKMREIAAQAAVLREEAYCAEKSLAENEAELEAYKAHGASQPEQVKPSHYLNKATALKDSLFSDEATWNWKELPGADPDVEGNQALVLLTNLVDNEISSRSLQKIKSTPRVRNLSEYIAARSDTMRDVPGWWMSIRNAPMARLLEFLRSMDKLTGRDVVGDMVEIARNHCMPGGTIERSMVIDSFCYRSQGYILRLRVENDEARLKSAVDALANLPTADEVMDEIVTAFVETEFKNNRFVDLYVVVRTNEEFIDLVREHKDISGDIECSMVSSLDISRVVNKLKTDEFSEEQMEDIRSNLSRVQNREANVFSKWGIILVDETEDLSEEKFRKPSTPRFVG